MTPPESVEKVAECHFFEFFSSGACAYGAASTECRESLAAQALFADLTHMSPNPNKAIRGCGPLSTPGFFDRLKARVAGFFICAGSELILRLTACVHTAPVWR